MPLLIRTPDEIFRSEPGKDLYYVEFFYPGKVAFLHGMDYSQVGDGVMHSSPEEHSVNPPGRQELLDWLSATLPFVKVEPLAPREGSGFLAGGIEGRLRIDFDPDSLAIFCARWENEEGSSLDSRWQCYHFPYETWLEGRYPRTAELIRRHPTLSTACGDVVSMFAFTPLTPEETGWPCMLGLYWDLHDQGLVPRVLLYRNAPWENHMCMDVQPPHAIAGDIGLTEAELALCRAALSDPKRQEWLLDRFGWNDEFAAQTVERY